MDGLRRHGVDPAQGLPPGVDVGRLPCQPFHRKLLEVLEDVLGVGGVADEEILAARLAHDHALVPHRVAGRRHHPDAGRHLRLAVQELEAGSGEVEPLAGQRLLAACPLQLLALDVEGRVAEDGVLAAVVPVEVGVDDHLHVGGHQAVLGEDGDHLLVDDIPIPDQLLGRVADAGVDQDRAGRRMLEDEAVDRCVEGPSPGAHASQVEPDHLHRGPAQAKRLPAARTVKSAAR